MNFSRRLCCVLLCACSLFVLCSGSVIAQDIDGTHIETYWSATEYGSRTNFVDTIETTEQLDEIYILVDCIVDFDYKDVFDCSLGVNFGDASSVQLLKVDLFNTEWSLVESVEGDFVGGVATAYDLQAPKNLNCIRFTFKVTNPSFDNVFDLTITNNTGGTETISVVDGMTWSDWVYSPYNTTGFAVVGNYIARQYNSSTYYEGVRKYSNSKYTYVSPTEIISPSGVYDIKLNTSIKTTMNSSGSTTTYSRHIYPFSITSFTTTVEDEGGLISNIIGWVKKIASSITELPSKIVNGIKDGIKSLFVPSEESMTQIKARFEALLAERFGAAYEAGALVDEFVSAFTYENNQSSIRFPEVTVNLVGTDFTFGGWNVDIIPKGLEILFDALKLIGNIVCTFLFVNALKKRFEGVVGS